MLTVCWQRRGREQNPSFVFLSRLTIQERAWHYLSGSLMKTSAQQQEKPNVSDVHSWERHFPMVQGCAVPTCWQMQTGLWLDLEVDAKDSKSSIWLGDSSGSSLGFCSAWAYHIQVHKRITYKRLPVISLSLKHIWIYCIALSQHSRLLSAQYGK